MTTKETKGYTKSTIDLMKVLKDQQRAFSKGVFKDPNETFEAWFNRKTDEAIKGMNGGMDEQRMSRKGDTQNPKPPFTKH